MIDIKIIKELFLKNGILIHEQDLINELEQERFPNEVNEYLRLMNEPIKLHVSAHGTAKTYLMSQKEIVDEYRSKESLPVISNNCLIIGFGANGDRLTINLSSGNVVYVFHDILWEEPEESFDEMSVDLNMKLEQFLVKAFFDVNYPFDAYLAEEYVNSNMSN